MKPYKSYPAIKTGWACFSAVYNLAFFMVPLVLGTKFLDIWGALVMLLILLGVAAAIGFISILCHELFGWKPEAKLAIGEDTVFVDGKTYPLEQITALQLQLGDLFTGSRLFQFDQTPGLLVITFADGSCCAASDPSVLFIHRLRKLCPEASFQIYELFRFLVKNPLSSLGAGMICLLLSKLGRL